jgi:hypothetical protein
MSSKWRHSNRISRSAYPAEERRRSCSDPRFFDFFRGISLERISIGSSCKVYIAPVEDTSLDTRLVPAEYLKVASMIHNSNEGCDCRFSLLKSRLFISNICVLLSTPTIEPLGRNEYLGWNFCKDFIWSTQRYQTEKRHRVMRRK